MLQSQQTAAAFDGQGIQLGLFSFQWISAKLDSKWQLKGELGRWVI